MKVRPTDRLSQGDDEMFLQVIRGKIGDRAAFTASLDQWVAELSPGAEGWLGSTGGAYDDGAFIILVRFSSADAAKDNSDRPEQGEWWAGFASALAGETSFEEYDDVIVLGPGGSDDAGFVQVMHGRVADAARERTMTAAFSELPMDYRSDVLGGLAAIDDDGRFVQAVYFTSEADAREGEKKLPPAEVEAMMEARQSNAVDISFIDLVDPLLQSPR